MTPEDFDGPAFAVALGDRLRAVRASLGLSLQAVSAASGNAFKASVLGAYERGERQVSVLRLQQLARCYGMTVDQLLPASLSDGLTIDLREGPAERSEEAERIVQAIVRARRPSQELRVRFGDEIVLASLRHMAAEEPVAP